MNQQTLKGQWNEISGKLREKWGQLTNDDLQQVQGNANQLVGLIQRKTGESRDAIEGFLDELTADGAGVVAKVAESAKEYAGQARDYAQHATESVRDAASNVTNRVREGYASAESMVHERPLESAAVAFGAGLIAGVIIGLSMRSR